MADREIDAAAAVDAVGRGAQLGERELLGRAAQLIGGPLRQALLKGRDAPGRAQQRQPGPRSDGTDPAASPAARRDTGAANDAPLPKLPVYARLR